VRPVACFFAVVALLACVSKEALGGCVTHFVNQSNVQWSIIGQNSDSKPLLIPANTTSDINWGAMATHVVLQGMLNNHSFTIFFPAQRNAGCYVLLPHGNTGKIHINKPNMGDITVCTGKCRPDQS
jgi:hypothetical protein